MKTVRQAQAAECGLACLAMIAAHHGHGTDLPTLRRQFGVSLKGANLARMVDAARALGLQPRPLRLDVGDLPKLRLPCVLHWDMNHFVVLAATRRGRAKVLDPGAGERWVDASELSRRFTGVALELSPGADFRPCPAPPAIRLRQLTGTLHGVGRALGSLLALSLALQVFVLLAPFYVQWTIDQAIVAADRDLLGLLALAFAGLLVLQAAIGVLRGWTVLHLSARIGTQWVGNVFAHLLRLPMDWFERRQMGDVVSRLGSVQALQRGLTTGAVEAVVDGLMASATFAMMLVYAPPLAAVTGGAVLGYVALRAATWPALRRRTADQLVAAARQQGHLLESLRGIQSLRVAGHEGPRQAAHANLVVDTANAEVKLAWLGLGAASGNQLVFGAERLLVIWLAATRVLEGAFTVGMLVAYLAYRDQFALRVAAFVDRGLEFRMLRLHGERLADVVLEPPDDDAPGGSGVCVGGERGLVAHDLGYRYAPGEPWVLRHCSFRIDEGECVALVGGSGGGKTTLMKLLLGLLPPGEGEIRLDGVPLARHGRRAFRTLVGAVMQDDQLFAGSLADNIALGDPEPDQARIVSAATLAAIHDDIAAMPMGYHSLVGDMGSSLSGGQRQRVMLARALYRRPRFLFLDEATSHLDLVREKQVGDAIRGLRITRLVIAHRPETIASADRVLVLDGGRIVADQRVARPIAPSPGVAEIASVT
jgi:ATP-binding cassette, subfamily B, bacterial CvaB/MchF/RaxB